MPYLIDTNALRLVLERDARAVAKIGAIPAGELWVSIIAVREALDGYHKIIRDYESRKSLGLYVGYSFLLRFLMEVRHYPIFPYDEESERLVRSWGNWTRHIGINDCRIAACALVHGLTVVTADRDFDRIRAKIQESDPERDLSFEDWTR